MIKVGDPNNTYTIPTTYININDNNYPNCVNLSSITIKINDQIAGDDDDMDNYTYKQCDDDEDDNQI